MVGGIYMKTEESFRKEVQPDQETSTQRVWSLTHGHTAQKWRNQELN